MRVSQLFHWSPADRYHSIAEHGLILHAVNVICSEPYGFVCASPDPRTAWNLSGAVATEISGYHSAAWDLWHITVDDSDELHIRAEFGPLIQEVQIRNAIPPARLWHIGRRDTAGITGRVCHC